MTSAMVSEIARLGDDFGPMEEATAFAILEAAVESGTDFFDTADVYGDGVSEKLIGQFLNVGETFVGLPFAKTLPSAE